MKLIFKLIFGLFAVGVMVCPTAYAQHKSTPAAVSISGKINLDDNYIAIFSDQRGENKEAVEVPLTKTGLFNWKSNVKSTGFVKVSFIPKSRKQQLAAIFPVYVQSGSKVQLNLSYSDATYLTLLRGKLDGNNKAMIEYSNFCFLKMRDMFKNRPSAVDQIKGVIRPYLEKADAYLEKYAVKNQMVKQYMDVWAMNNYLNGLFSLPGELRRSNKNVELPGDYFAFPKSPASVYNHDVAILHNETFMNVDHYINMLIKEGEGSSDNYGSLKHKYKVLDSLFTNKVLITQIVSGSLNEFIRKYNLKANTNFEDEQEKFKSLAAYVENEKKRAELINSFSNLKYTLKGAKLPDVSFKDVTGKEVNLQSLKGNYIYIDLWASWCVPCIAEIPNLHNLENDYKGKNIAFVSISLDENKKAWRDKMMELKLEGVQLELGDSNYDKLMNVSGIPHFLLYDPAGKLLMYKAPRPSTKEIRTILDQSLSAK